MKRISSLAAILLLTVAFMGCEPAETAPEETTNETSQTELELNQVAFGIEGMT
ncbi:MAG: hypothetical protein ACKVK0_00665 [Pirellulales bacterium]|jgi:PBP1b-binding outer membrane lipoprotein LpoB|tara:strand:+ start:313 stop:471 length:159 start_codon:yes stop_codon:yes gene_type:complete